MRETAVETMAAIMVSLEHWTHADGNDQREKDKDENEDDDNTNAPGEEDQMSPRAGPNEAQAAFSKQFTEQRAAKLTLATGIERFNRKPTRGLQWLYEHKMLEETAPAVAEFLSNETHLDKTKIGEFLVGVLKTCHSLFLTVWS